MILSVVRCRNKGHYIDLSSSGITKLNYEKMLSYNKQQREFYLDNGRITNTFYRDIVSIFCRNYSDYFFVESRDSLSKKRVDNFYLQIKKRRLLYLMLRALCSFNKKYPKKEKVFRYYMKHKKCSKFFKMFGFVYHED